MTAVASKAIFLDTEVFFRDLHLDRSPLVVLREQLRRNKTVRLLISEVVVLECVAHFRRQCQDHLAAYDKARHGVSRFFHRAAPDALNLDLDEYVLEYERRFRSSLIDGFGARIVPIPALDSTALVRRSIEKRKPFSERGCGYRDAVIWYSVVSASKNHRLREIAFVSNNSSDFGAPDGSIHPDLLTVFPGNRGGIVRYFTRLDDAIAKTFASPLPVDTPLLEDAEWHRTLVSSRREEIIEEIEDDLASRYYRIALNDLSNEFKILSVETSIISDSEASIKLGVRFWRCDVTNWFWTNRHDFFRKHSVDLDCWITAVVSRADRSIQSFDARLSDVGPLGPILSEERRPIE